MFEEIITLFTSQPAFLIAFFITITPGYLYSFRIREKISKTKIKEFDVLFLVILYTGIMLFFTVLILISQTYFVVGESGVKLNEYINRYNQTYGEIPSDEEASLYYQGMQNAYFTMLIPVNIWLLFMFVIIGRWQIKNKRLKGYFSDRGRRIIGAFTFYIFVLYLMSILSQYDHQYSLFLSIPLWVILSKPLMEALEEIDQYLIGKKKSISRKRKTGKRKTRK